MYEYYAYNIIWVKNHTQIENILSYTLILRKISLKEKNNNYIFIIVVYSQKIVYFTICDKATR